MNINDGNDKVYQAHISTHTRNFIILSFFVWKKVENFLDFIRPFRLTCPNVCSACWWRFLICKNKEKTHKWDVHDISSFIIFKLVVNKALTSKARIIYFLILKTRTVQLLELITGQAGFKHNIKRWMTEIINILRKVLNFALLQSFIFFYERLWWTKFKKGDGKDSSDKTII